MGPVSATSRLLAYLALILSSIELQASKGDVTDLHEQWGVRSNHLYWDFNMPYLALSAA